MKTLIIGQGEVGQALYDVCSKNHETFIRDVEPLACENVEILQIAYPDHDGFAETTKAYIAEYRPKLTIINSSVRAGTTDDCGKDVVYSPVRGRHPRLAESLRSYYKIVAGRSQDYVNLAVAYFRLCGMRCLETNDVIGAELVKLLSNIHMGLEIAWRQEVDRILAHFGAEADTYEAWEDTYAVGYQNDGDTHLMRPRMRPDPIGGHCILPCTELLKTQFKSKALDFILESNKQAKKERKNVLAGR